MSNENEYENEIIKLVKELDKNVVVDNDFVNAYSIPFDKFEKYSKEDLIETLFVLSAIHEENLKWAES